MQTILVSGATGTVGREVLRALLQRKSADYRIIAGVRDVDKSRQEHGDLEELEYRLLDFSRPATARASLQGVDRMFLILPPGFDHKAVLAVVDVAKEACVTHIVYLSVQGVERMSFIPHYKIERYVEESGIAYTFLRPSFFMQNLSTVHREEIRDRNEIFVPAGKGRTNFIDVRDIGDVSALSLTEPGHENKAYELTGSEALDYYQVTAIFRDQLDKDISYVRPGALWFFLTKLRQGESLGRALIMVLLYTNVRLGNADGTTTTVEELLGRPPRSLAEFLVDNGQAWTAVG